MEAGTSHVYQGLDISPFYKKRNDMYKQITMIRDLNHEILEETGIHQAYEKFCGSLKLEDLFTPDSVYVAASRCASGFMHKSDTRKFMSGAYKNSVLLCESVLDGTFVPRYYKAREITERGKKRLIVPPKFECKVVQKVLCDYLVRPLLEPKMIEHNYAAITSRGTMKLYQDVLKAVNKNLGSADDMVIIKEDFHNYFASIDVSRIFDEVMGRYIADKRIVDLMKLFSRDMIGLSLGNELSQIPASFFPSAIDHYMKDKCGVPYFRYMDDALIICYRHEASSYIASYQTMADDLGLNVNEKKIEVIPIGKPFVFCKERFLIDKRSGNYYLRQNPAAVRNEMRKLTAFKDMAMHGQISKEEIDIQFRSVAGAIASHPNNYKNMLRLQSKYSEAISAFEEKNELRLQVS